MTTRKIEPVHDNTEKHQTYRQLLGRYSRAMKQGFYYEAIMISYAMIEDRMRSMIYHMGFLANREATSIWKKSRSYLQSIVTEYKAERENDSLGISTLSGKAKIIRCVLLWASNTAGGYKDNKHLSVLKSQLESIDIGGLQSVLVEIDDWRDGRNEIVHAMLNKNILHLEESAEPLAKKGMQLARALDAKEREIKAGNRIRRKINLPMNLLRMNLWLFW